MFVFSDEVIKMFINCDVMKDLSQCLMTSMEPLLSGFNIHRTNSICNGRDGLVNGCSWLESKEQPWWDWKWGIAKSNYSLCVLYGMVNTSIYKDSLLAYRNTTIDGYIYIYLDQWLPFDYLSMKSI